MAFRFSVEKARAPRTGVGNVRASAQMNSENVLE